MRLLKFATVLIFILLIAITVLASVNYANHINGSDGSNKDLTIEDGIRAFKEEVCVDDEKAITCVENTYEQKTKNSVPKLTSYTIRETVFVPKYIEKEKIIVKENKPMGEEKYSPDDRIKESDIYLYSSGVRIGINNAKMRKFIDSNSMDPLIDEGTTTIEIKPMYADEIKIGDIIAYKVDGYDYAFVHRVVDIGEDEQNIYFSTKGDNYYKEDPNKVRFEQIEGIIVGVLY